MHERLLAAAMIFLAPGPAVAFVQAEPDQRLPDALPGPDTPIISDEEFEAALPRIDGDLDAPLPPITPAPPPAASDAAAEPAAEAAPDPAAAGDPDAPVAVLPPIDLAPPGPELTAPLPPIGSFALEPVPEDVLAAQEIAEEVRYRLRIEGLSDVDLAGRFRQLSALAEADGEAANGAVVAARAEEDERLALSLLHAEGYWDAVVTSTVEPAPGQAAGLIATISAVPGKRYVLGQIAVTGPDTEPPGLARAALGLKPGEPLVAARVEAEEANILLALPRQGYPFVELGRRDVVLDPATQRADYSLPVEPGPRSAFGVLSTSGDQAFDAAHVATLTRFAPGQLYDSRLVDDLREAMIATNLFASVAVERVRTGVTDASGNAIVDLQVVQNAGPPRTLAGQAGYQTGQGFTLRGTWTHRNLFPPEGALILEGVAGTREQGAAVTFRRANAGKRDRTVNLSLRGARQRYQAFDALTASVTGRISRESTPIWQKIWTWAYGFELIASDENRRDRSRRADSGTFFIAALPAQLGYDRSNDLLDPTRGFRLTGRISPEISQQASGGFESYVRGLLDASGYFPVRDDLVIAGRARVGSIAGTGRDRIAPSRRLYAGGGGSVRGFGFQELGPRDVENDPLGGRSLVEFALEARYRFGNFGVVPFVDVGQVYESSTPRLSNLRAGVGIGGRYYTNFGPIRLDVATPIDRRPGESRITVYISIGQAF